MNLSKLKVLKRGAFFYEVARDRRILSVGLGGFEFTSNYSYDYTSTDLAQTLSGRLAQVAATACFVDISQGAIDAFSGKINADILRVDITSAPAGWPAALSRKSFEVIFLGEVLEHLTDPGTALRNLLGLLEPSGRLVVSVPSAFSLPGIAHALFGRENIHPEHTCYYSPATITRLMEMCGYEVESLAWHGWKANDFRTLYRKPLTLIMLGASLLIPRFSHGVIAVAKPRKLAAAE